MKRSALLVTILLAACGGGAHPATTVASQPPEPAPVADRAPTPPPAPAAATHAKLTKVRTVEGITEYRMDNGMQVLMFPDDSQSTLTVNVTYLVGSRVEGYGETGMAHLLEHMMFKGSPRHRNVLKLLGERGAQLNGSTWNDRTNYYETLPATQDNLDYALDLESDRMVNASISADDLKTEFSVVRNEFEIGENNPQSILDERVVSTAFLWHNYGKSTIGSRADIEKVPVPALRAFYEKYYQPDNAVLILAGKFDDAAAKAAIEKTFGAIPRPTRVLAASYTVEPVQDGEREVTLRRNGDVNLLALAYHTVGAASPDYAACDAAMDVLTRKPSGRLYKQLVESKLATSVSSSSNLFKDPFLAQIGVEIRDPKNVAKVEPLLLAQVEGLGKSKIDPKELERWRASTLKDLKLAFADSTSIAVFLSEFAGLGDWRTLFAYRNSVKAVTVADVQRVAAMYFKQSNRTLGRFVPSKEIDRAPFTETPDVAAIVKSIEGGDAETQGEAFAATLDNIEARTTRKELKGGIKAALLPKKTRGGKVQLQLQFHWGNEHDLQNTGTIASLASAMLARGTTKHSYQELQDLQDQYTARVVVSGSADGFTLTIETVRDQLASAIDLGAEMMTMPAFSDKELATLKADRIAKLEQAQSDPQAIAVATAQQIMSPWPKSDPRATLTPAERIVLTQKVTAAQLRAYYKTFAGAGHAELSVVGDFDASAVPAQIEKLFGGWTSKKPYTRLVSKPFGIAAQQKSVQIKDKEMTMVFGGHDLAMKDSDPDYAAWLMVGQILGGDASSRLWMRVREHEGLSYGVGAWTSADALDEAGSFGLYAMVAPQNLAKAKASIMEEITRMASSAPTADELAKAKSAWIQSMDTQLSDDGYVASSLNEALYDSRTLEYRKQLRAKVQAVTIADVARVAAARLSPSKLIVIDAGDSSKTATK